MDVLEEKTRWRDGSWTLQIQSKFTEVEKNHVSGTSEEMSKKVGLVLAASLYILKCMRDVVILSIDSNMRLKLFKALQPLIFAPKTCREPIVNHFRVQTGRLQLIVSIVNI